MKVLITFGNIMGLKHKLMYEFLTKAKNARYLVIEKSDVYRVKII